LGRGCGGRSSWRRIGDGSARIVVAAAVELPAAIADIAYHNKAVIYDILFKAAAETFTTVAADPKHLGARIGFTAVLHSWVRRLRITRTSTSSCRAVASREMGNGGSHAGPVSSSPSACSRGSFDVCFWSG
jgi:hypothetical protein